MTLLYVGNRPVLIYSASATNSSEEQSHLKSVSRDLPMVKQQQ
ncbi:hypothetical protein E2C01_077797 [Portunus trituberculatus]|uniref:Uncharacterized protein n=1 Tax=Portunus trituberculatus TaxID=210409 RepID=A0A5B7IN89_PORTR|nr:hypothetical protein [Portunus trituberculatus]